MAVNDDGVANRGDLRIYEDVADSALEVGAILGLYGLEAIRDSINGWHRIVAALGKAGNPQLVTLRTA
jgi:hypothetical protein